MMAKIDTPFTSDAELDHLVELFESCRLPYERWTHRAHLAVAVNYVQRYALPEAIDRVRTGIQRYNESRGDFTGYHETITVLFVRLVAHERTQSQLQLNAAELVNELADRRPLNDLLNYYSPERLWSDQARASWVEPDLKPLDF
jgi:hypothetical protein